MIKRSLYYRPIFTINDTLKSFLTHKKPYNRKNIYFNQKQCLSNTVRNFSSVSPTLTNNNSSIAYPNQDLSHKPSDTKFIFNDNFPVNLKKEFAESFLIYENFVNEEEEKNLMEEFEKHFKRHLYEKDHWDNAIAKFRETEKKFFNKTNTPIVERIRNLAFPQTGKHSKVLPYTHVLDLAEDGYIKPHVDSVRFCGDRVAVLSLLSSSVARFRLDKDREVAVDVCIPRLSLYVMKGISRYDFAHEILKNDESNFDGEHIQKGRRISVIRRNEP